MDYLIFIISLSVLVFGADIIINQSGKIALKMGISEYVIGATLIALGTSLPEMAASISASLHGHGELSVSNIVGSNIINISLILSIVLFLSTKINPHRDFFSKDSSWALFPVLIFIAIILSHHIPSDKNEYIIKIGRIHAIALIMLMIGYIIFLMRHDKDTLEIAEDIEVEQNFNWLKTIILLIIGFILVTKGADYTVLSASNIAHKFGISEWIIGLLLIAFGTSLPELIVSIVAAFKNKGDMAIGNIIGSNLANITIALGLAAAAHPITINILPYVFDIAIMVIATLMLVFITANKMYSQAASFSLLALFLIFLSHALKISF